MDIQMQKLLITFLTWSLVVPILLGSTRSVDPILTHMCCTLKYLIDETQLFLAFCKKKKVLIFNMASFNVYAAMENGVKFWREFLDCSILLDAQIQAVLDTCIPVSSPEEVEKTRCSVCLNPDGWVKMMECMNAHLIELQDESNPYLELSPGLLYRSCISVLVSEADRSLYRQIPFLPEDDRDFSSDCSSMEL